jgi:hypothetical protein
MPADLGRLEGAIRELCVVLRELPTSEWAQEEQLLGVLEGALDRRARVWALVLARENDYGKLSG